MGGQKHPVPHQNVDIAFSISSFGLELLLLSLEPSVSRPKPTARIPEHALKNHFSIRGGGARFGSFEDRLHFPRIVSTKPRQKVGKC